MKFPAAVAWAPPEAAPPVDAPAADIDIEDYYQGGHTFHGPTLQAMTEMERLGPQGAVATFHTRPDADLLGLDAHFVLDPLLLDTATHPMCSAEPERWVEGLADGKLAYPVRAEQIRFFAPRPCGAVRCTVARVSADPTHLCFDVHLEGEAGPYCAFRWTEAVVEAGPFLGHPAPIRRRFLWDRRATPEVTIGRASTRGWRVDLTDLVEPLPGTQARLACVDSELDARAGSADPGAWDAATLAAKECVRAWLRQRIDRDVHPSAVRLVHMRPDRYVVQGCPSLTAQEYAVHLGPTRFSLRVSADADGAEAWLEPVD